MEAFGISEDDLPMAVVHNTVEDRKWVLPKEQGGAAMTDKSLYDFFKVRHMLAVFTVYSLSARLVFEGRTGGDGAGDGGGGRRRGRRGALSSPA
jgi:hypothetical protein